MKNKLLALSIIILLVVLLSGAYLALGHKKVDAPTQSQPKNNVSQASPTPIFTGTDDILKNALNLYLEKKREATDMGNGSCLGKIADDWVLDIAHNPRQPVDDKPENQCRDFIDGKAHHFIELDPEGKLIRTN